MNFNEQDFRHLVEETESTIIRFGTTSHTVLNRHKRFTEMLVDHLKAINMPFELNHCLEWVNSMEHGPANVLDSSYIDWIAFHRFIHLLAEQEEGTLSSWHYYSSVTPELPQNPEFKNILISYKAELKSKGKKPSTVQGYGSRACKLLLYLEDAGISQFSRVVNRDIVNYLKTDRFKNRSVKGIQTELCSIKNFLNFTIKAGYTTCELLPYALPKIRRSNEKIITTIDKKIEEDLLEDKAVSLVNKRDKAILLLALHTGLRSCDIRELRFSDLDWERETIHIRQKKTGVDLEIPMDNETQNAIIDYVLNERRNCDQDYIFISSVGPVRKLARRQYRIKYRLKGTGSYDRLPHDGLHIYRRTFASRLLQTGTPLPLISDMLGHIDKNSVRSYLSTDEEKMKRCALSLEQIPCRREEY